MQRTDTDIQRADCRYTAVIPTYNNAETLAEVIRRTLAYCPSVIVVNDGSTDRTPEILRELQQETAPLEVLSHYPNRGKGYALQSGLRRAEERGFQYAITLDSDGQHDPDDIPRFLERIRQQPGSLLIGARNLKADNMPGKNTFANKFSNFWYAVETGKRLSDTQSGFRLYPLEKLRNLKTATSGYEYELEIMVRAAWRGIPVENIPIRVHYPEKEKRVSHFRPVRDFTRISLLNTVLVLAALFYYYPKRFFSSLNRENIRKFIRENITHSPESNARIAAAAGYGVFCGIIPLWGYQMIFAGVSAHFLKLNKIIAIAASNVSIPPMIPPILYGSLLTGGILLGQPVLVSFRDISFETISRSVLQYLIGSIVLAAAAGLFTAAATYLILKLSGRTHHG